MTIEAAGWLALVSASIGATVGANLTYRLPRASPIVLIHSIELSAALVDPEETVDRTDLDRKIKEYPIGLDVSHPSHRPKLAEWIQYLRSYQAALDEFIFDLSEADSTIKKIRSAVVAEEFHIAKKLLPTQHFLWHLVEGGYFRTREPVFSSGISDEVDLEKLELYGIDEDNDGNYFVNLDDGLVLMLDWKKTAPNARRAEAKKLAQQIALAVAQNHKQELMEYLDYARSQVPRLKELSSALHQAITDRLSEYQHLVLAAVLVNAGRLPYVVDTHARLVINLKGYPRVIQRRGGEFEEPISDDLPIDMTMEIISEFDEVVTLDRHLESLTGAFTSRTGRRIQRKDQPPRRIVAVSPGNPVRIRCVSRERVNEMALSRELEKAHSGGERQAYLVFSLLKPGKAALQTWYSKRVPFRGATQQMDLPLKPFKRRSGRFSIR